MSDSHEARSPAWTGDLNDDCSAEWKGLLVRAEWMDGSQWWWCVYDQVTGEQIASSDLVKAKECVSGPDARAAAEEAAFRFRPFRKF